MIQKLILLMFILPAVLGSGSPVQPAGDEPTSRLEQIKKELPEAYAPFIDSFIKDHEKITKDCEFINDMIRLNK